jgi:hypothetical protein
MGLRKNNKTDVTLENEGVEIPVDMNDHNKQPIVIRIARMSKSNKRYAKALELATRPHQSAIENETLDNELGDTILREVFVDTILLSWKNLPKSELTGDDKDTAELPFSRENALALFEELPGVYDDWVARAKKVSNFREAVRTVAAKN